MTYFAARLARQPQIGQFEGPWTLQGQPLDAAHLTVLPRQNTSVPTRYVYVVEFGSGWVKVGHTMKARNRMQQHARSKTAVTQPGSMQRCWVSRLLCGSGAERAVEKKLVAFAAELCSDRHRNEYFNGCSFDVLVEAGTRFADAPQHVEAAS